MTVRRSAGQVDRWRAIPGVTRWVDYSHAHVGPDLVVYAHTFRRGRERVDGEHDALMWRPTSSGIAHHYADGEWAEVVESERSWPPYDVELVPRGRDRRSPRGR